MKSKYKRTVELLKKSGFLITVNDDNVTVFTNETLRVGVFGPEYPHLDHRNHVLSDHETNFDKWSKWFYKCEMPGTEEEQNILVDDLRYIQNEDNRKSSNCFGHLRRDF